MIERIEKLTEMLAESPNDAFLKHALALENIKLGKDEVAKMLFEEILKKDASYVGSYYHLGKLLERLGDNEGALVVYENGMKEANSEGDKHAYNELMMARDDNDAYEF